MTTPPQPPEGALIENARQDAGMSARDAARRAGISEGWWRQVTRGYQKLSGGESGAVRAPARTIASMAKAVHLTPDQLSGAGRDDAARELKETLRRENAAALAATTPEPPRDQAAADDAGAMTSGIVIAALPWMERQVWAHIRRRLQATPSGTALFTDPAQTALWPADSAPITLTPEALQVLEALTATALFSDPVEELTWRLEMDPPHQRVREIASRRAARWSLRRPNRPARRAG